MDELRRRLEAKNYIWTQFYDRRLSSRRGPTLLSQRISQSKQACLLLVHSSEAMQKWAQEQAINSVVLGTSFPDIDLPSIDTDYHALGWHAAGQLVKAGHRRVSLLLPPNSPGGDRATQQGLLEYLQSMPGTPCRFSLDPVTNQPLELQAAIDRILARRNPPTAFFSFLPLHTLTLLTHLLQRGVRIPGDIALISRDSEFYLNAVTPEPARYERNESAFITQTIRLIEKVSSGVPPVKKSVRLIPSFKPGRTI
jgi:DNA-binding LacI/PurR family transcriptional regulator